MSSIPAVKAALVSVLTPLLPNTQVIYGPGSSVSLTTNRILVVGEGATAGTVDITSLGLGSATETYTLTLLASVSLSGSDPSVAEGQAFADMASVVAAIQASPNLGLPNVSVAIDGSFELSETANDSGRSSDIRFPAAVFAVI